LRVSVTDDTARGLIRPLRMPASFAGRLALVVAAGLAVRIAYVVVVMPHVTLGFDSVWYGLQAGTIADGKGYINPAAYFGYGGSVATANFPPLWPTVLAGIYKLGGHTARSFELVGCVLGAGTGVLAGLLGRRLAGSTAGVLSAALVGASPFLIAADGSLMAESLFVLLMTGGVLLAYAASDRPTPVRWLTLGAVLGLAALTRSDGLLLGPLLVVVVAWRARTLPAAKRFARATLAIGAIVAVVAPWAVRNSAALGEPVVLSSNSGSLLEGANCSATYGGADLGGWAGACLQFTDAPHVVEADASRRARDHAIRYARAHLGRLPLVGTVRALRIWGLYDPVEQSRAEAVESRPRVWQLLGWAYSLVLLPFAVTGALRLRRQSVDLRPLLAIVAGVTVLAVLSWGNQRFRLAAEPAVLVLAAVGTLAAVERIRHRAPNRVAARSGGGGVIAGGLG
jgi:4-amino-4-deoxy-L-arabinose transferase-like glycosyltransferase